MEKYNRINWQDSPSTATPLDAENLNKMDAGIEAVTDAVIELESDKVSRTELEENYYNIDDAETAFANKHNTEEALALLGRNKADKEAVERALGSYISDIDTLIGGDDN